MSRHPNDTQYSFPTKESPFVIMRYGDGWGVYNRAMDAMVLLATNDHPFEVKTPESCESLIRMLLAADLKSTSPLTKKSKRRLM